MVATFPIVIEDMTLDDIDGVQEVERASFRSRGRRTRSVTS